ncbi:DeoR/GlpR transcriptional regulator [Oceanobacillus piezotolerans]|uniref:DeoR/GlpR transcriptional regulator n=1 Tax=Oceanobacillus piezotolerans TaxID=2448030 RepID=A0A498D9Q6_9BACI|nr:DeoR/GlpR family DNA-binding transcription regulator [Oceanobacillus piezotolerans]RLL43660.1 DeoR/GlpR transcriptional regulator [Oceanobacillus piezotolerans]
MLTDERYAVILDRLKDHGIVKTQELMNLLHCSESTIRRDLDSLERSGKLKRIHGGAKRMYHLDEELSNQDKTTKNVQEKSNIGQLAASLVQPKDVIFIDAGTTTLALIEALKVGNITVVTNGIPQASLLAEKNIPTILIGGSMKMTTKAIIGETAVEQLKQYQFSKAFLGINGMDLEFGFTTPDPEEAAIKRLVIQKSASTYIVADETKWGKVNFVKVCNLEDVTIITNKTNDDYTAIKEKTTILEA